MILLRTTTYVNLNNDRNVSNNNNSDSYDNNNDIANDGNYFCKYFNHNCDNCHGSR